MAYLLDTSVLGRLANNADSCYSVAVHAVVELHRRGETLHITPQNLIEFRNVATRPAAVNGLGLTPGAADVKSGAFESAFSLLVETPDIFPLWKSIVHSMSVVGKQVHDARLVAVCHAHHISHLLTFNVSHFARFATFAPGITIIDPADV